MGGATVALRGARARPEQGVGSSAVSHQVPPSCRSLTRTAPTRSDRPASASPDSGSGTKGRGEAKVTKRQAGRQPGAGVHHRPGPAGPCAAVDLLAMPGVEDLDLPLPHHRELARAADLA